MIEVLRIPISKERLSALPEDERGLLLMLGHVSNQLSMLQKILVLSTNGDPKTEVEQIASAVQTQMLVRLTLSAAYEAWRVVQVRFLSGPLGADYDPRLDAKGREALGRLKKYFGKPSLVYAVRNDYGFHYPKPSDVEAAFQAAMNDPDSDDNWQLYFSEHGFNSLFVLSELIYMHGIALKADAADLESSQRKLMNDLQRTSLDVIEFSRAFVAAVWLKRFGNFMDAEEVVRVEAVRLGDAALPFFVEMS